MTAEPDDSESWIALGDTYRTSERNAEAVDAYDHAEKTIAHPGKRDWPMYYARAMAKERLHRLDDSRSRHPDRAEAVAGSARLLNYSGYSWVDRGRRISEALQMLEKARFPAAL